VSSEKKKATLSLSELVEEPHDILTALRTVVEFRCSASVTTAVSCAWKHNDSVIKTNCQKSLILHIASPSDGGSYTCEIRGNAGKPLMSSAKVEILDMLNLFSKQLSL